MSSKNSAAVMIITVNPLRADFPTSKTAAASKATIAGVAPLMKFCTTVNSLKRRKKTATSTIAVNEGSIAPNAADSAPGIPATLLPTKTAVLMAIDPGILWETAIPVRKSSEVTHLFFSTISVRISGSMT